ncbi:MAG: hypothetical protein M1816_007418 [Peltula sp. TS41687]|nr:MAG: hypothetical protein M1816_007418 [Peltula sp. TS41687]
MSSSRSQQDPTPSQSSPMSNLPTELLDEIFSHCDVPDLYNAMQTCQRNHEIIVPELYRTVDLRFDNPRFSRGLPQPLTRHTVLKIMTRDPASSPAPETAEDRAVMNWWRAQQRFIRAVETRPELGRLVRGFAWTLYTEDGIGVQGSGQELHPEEGVLLEEGVEKFLCQRFPNARKVHIDGLGGPHRHPTELVPRAAMNIESDVFPRVSKLKFSGDLSISFLQDLLASLNQANLTDLELDAIQHAGGARLPPLMAPAGFYLLAPLTQCVLQKSTRCTSLKKLTVRMMVYPGGWLTMADFILERYARMLSTVRATLQQLEFEIFEMPEVPPEQPCDRWPDKTPSVDGNLQQMISSELARGNWPCLTRVQIRGLRAQPNWDPRVIPAVAHNIRRDLQFDVQREPDKQADVTYLSGHVFDDE